MLPLVLFWLCRTRSIHFFKVDMLSPWNRNPHASSSLKPLISANRNGLMANGVVPTASKFRVVICTTPFCQQMSNSLHFTQAMTRLSGTPIRICFFCLTHRVFWKSFCRSKLPPQIRQLILYCYLQSSVMQGSGTVVRIGYLSKNHPHSSPKTHTTRPHATNSPANTHASSSFAIPQGSGTVNPDSGTSRRRVPAFNRLCIANQCHRLWCGLTRREDDSSRNRPSVVYHRVYLSI